jgi:hypothetical protein
VSQPTLRRVPVTFVPAYLAVNVPTMLEMLGLNDGRAERDQKRALAKILTQKKLNDKWLPGRVFPLRELEKALTPKN